MNEKAQIGGNATRSSSLADGRVAKNALILVSLRVIMPVLGVALVLTLSRYLGVDGLGRYTLAFTYLYVFSALAPLGLSTIITRDGARDYKGLERLLGNSVILGALASGLFTLAMACLAYIFDYDQATEEAILVLSLAILPSTIKSFYDSAFIALERMDYILISTVGEYLVKVGGGLYSYCAGMG